MKWFSFTIWFMSTTIGGNIVNKTGRIIGLIISILITGLGIAMTIKTNIGVAPYDAFNLTASWLIEKYSHGRIALQFGTMTMITNTICILIQVAYLGKKFELKRLLQLLFAYGLGYVINFGVTVLFVNLPVDVYLYRVIFNAIGVVIMGIGIGLLLAINYGSFPLEPTVMVLCERYGWKFPRARQMLDVMIIVTIPFVCWFTGLENTIREGTVISMVLFTPVMKYTLFKVLPILENENNDKKTV